MLKITFFLIVLLGILGLNPTFCEVEGATNANEGNSGCILFVLSTFVLLALASNGGVPFVYLGITTLSGGGISSIEDVAKQVPAEIAEKLPLLSSEVVSLPVNGDHINYGKLFLELLNNLSSFTFEHYCRIVCDHCWGIVITFIFGK